jgi:hypothetical protein
MTKSRAKWWGGGGGDQKETGITKEAMCSIDGTKEFCFTEEQERKRKE